ncbi:hypothetical protein SDRG_14004 [Saprolegnia diclina VS20]|uniref:START domain-containing protein n=1 Tax=Saprolegnia diclina (strain VS20) TaxID=1156394 RepID=T0PRQ9_SAPDV|nr:hypothetical protein SDRG_14004 [Saprolegnia diclina VS20]EQC28179.1 hypothetical protein SDRG_14004 [Saprolegnia diclina VS20]|eukprot:XP_008618328.1 hypothetical protein SDRG_14004 [Saprolegnia diclina VS20]
MADCVMPTVFPDEDEATCMAHISAFLATTSDFGLDASALPTSTHDTPSSPSCDEPLLPSKKRSRPKHEIEHLHATHAELERQLQLLQLLRPPSKALGPWQARAIHQAEAAQRSLHENSRLKDLVAEKRKLLDAVERILTKRPRFALTEPSHDEKMEQRLQLQLDQMDSEWIRRRLYDATPSTRETTIERSAKDGAIVSFGSVAKLVAPLDFESMGELLWAHKASYLGPSCRVQRAAHKNLAYTRELVHIADFSLPALETQDCFRRFVEPDRIVILWRSLSDDEDIALPAAGHLIGHRWGWLEIERKNTWETTVRCSMTTQIPSLPATEPISAASAWSERLMQWSLANKEAVGNIIQAAVMERRQQLGLTTHAAIFQDLKELPIVHREELF